MKDENKENSEQCNNNNNPGTNQYNKNDVLSFNYSHSSNSNFSFQMKDENKENSEQCNNNNNPGTNQYNQNDAPFFNYSQDHSIDFSFNKLQNVCGFYSHQITTKDCHNSNLTLTKPETIFSQYIKEKKNNKEEK